MLKVINITHFKYVSASVYHIKAIFCQTSLHERQPKHYQAGKSHHTFSILWKYDHKNLSRSTIKPQNVHIIFLRRGFITFSWHVPLTALFIINPLCPHIYMSGCLYVYFLPTSHENAARPLPRTVTREWRRNVNFKGKDFFFFFF